MDENTREELLNKLALDIKYNKKNYFKPAEWQMEFFAKGKDVQQRYLMAANRVGKSYCSAYELALHATGDYPDWWEGFRYDYPPKLWIVGSSAEQMAGARGYQEHLMGPFGDYGTGFLPRNSITKKINSKTPGAYKTIEVRHTHGVSRIDFKAYSQNQEALMSVGVDFIAIDEEPKNPKIYGQLTTRISSAKANGRIIISATPEHGLTPLVRDFQDESLKINEGLMNVTVYDAHVSKGGHLEDEDIQRMEDNCPPHEREMRLMGQPKMGDGAVWGETRKSDITVEPFDIPNHWIKCGAVDFGWNHPYAVAFAAYDHTTDTVYIYDVVKDRKQPVPIIASQIKSRGKHIPIVYPHDGNNETLNGIALAQQFLNEGCNMHYERFKNPEHLEGKRDNDVETGLTEMRTRMVTGRFKVFSNCKAWLDEFDGYQYQVRPNGKAEIIKRNDDAMDAGRYVTMSIIQGIGDTRTSFNEWHMGDDDGLSLRDSWEKNQGKKDNSTFYEIDDIDNEDW